MDPTASLCQGIPSEEPSAAGHAPHWPQADHGQKPVGASAVQGVAGPAFAARAQESGRGQIRLSGCGGGLPRSERPFHNLLLMVVHKSTSAVWSPGATQTGAMPRTSSPCQRMPVLSDDSQEFYPSPPAPIWSILTRHIHKFSVGFGRALKLDCGGFGPPCQSPVASSIAYRTEPIRQRNQPMNTLIERASQGADRFRSLADTSLAARKHTRDDGAPFQNQRSYYDQFCVEWQMCVPQRPRRPERRDLCEVWHTAHS